VNQPDRPTDRGNSDSRQAVFSKLGDRTRRFGIFYKVDDSATGAGAGGAGGSTGAAGDPGNNTTTGAGAGGAGAAGATGAAGAGAAAAASAAAKPSADAVPSDDGKMFSIHASAFAKLKEKERLRGEAGVRTQLDEEAKGLGYASHAAMIQILRERRASAGESRGTSGATTKKNSVGKGDQGKTDEGGEQSAARSGTPARGSKAERRLMEKLNAEKRERQKLARKAAELEQRLEYQRARSALVQRCRDAGVREVDFVIDLMERQTAALEGDDVLKFDEQAFIEGLRKDKSYLFGEVVRAAQTGAAGAPGVGTGNGAAGARASQAAAGPAPTKANERDGNGAFKMAREAWKQGLRKMGLDPEGSTSAAPVRNG
jgi:hypothetical protein